MAKRVQVSDTREIISIWFVRLHVLEHAKWLHVLEHVRESET